jgi:hypothetical protein
MAIFGCLANDAALVALALVDAYIMSSSTPRRVVNLVAWALRFGYMSTTCAAFWQRVCRRHGRGSDERTLPALALRQAWAGRLHTWASADAVARFEFVWPWFDACSWFQNVGRLIYGKGIGFFFPKHEEPE